MYGEFFKIIFKKIKKYTTSIDYKPSLRTEDKLTIFSKAEQYNIFHSNFTKKSRDKKLTNVI